MYKRQAQWSGRFPRRAADIETLPGIGRSTAAAIAVFAFGARAAILDGNVKRVLTRVLAVSYTHLRAHETVLDLVCRLLLEKKTEKYYTAEFWSVAHTTSTH